MKNTLNNLWCNRVIKFGELAIVIKLIEDQLWDKERDGFYYKIVLILRLFVVLVI